MEKEREREKDQKFAIGRRSEMRKRLDPQNVKDQRISSLAIVGLPFVFALSLSFLSLFGEINDPFHLFAINILIQHILLLLFRKLFGFSAECATLCKEGKD
jgi:hypothetical protein